MTQTKLSQLLTLLFSFIAGASLTLAFAPFHYWPFAFIAPALLLLLWQHTTPKRAFYRGALFGLGFIGTGLSWIYVSLHVYGQANPLVAGGITAVMVVLLAGYIAIQGYLLQRFFPQNHWSKYLLVFPALWVLQEWWRGYFLTGFPWVFLGYSQLDTTWRSFAPLIGVYGVSWLVALISGGLAWLATEAWHYYRSRFSSQNYSHATNKIILSCVILAPLLVSAISVPLLNKQWTTPVHQPLTVSLIQGNIPQTLKWQPEQFAESLATYHKLTQQHLTSPLIIWPEAAITVPPQQLTGYLDHLDQLAKAHHTTILTGIPIVEPRDDHTDYYNGLITLGAGHGVYLKRHLVPFGEFMPLKFALLWLKAYVEIPMSDFGRGARHQPLVMAGDIPLATFICYEISYPTEVLDQLPAGQLLVTISDDSWFGDSIAPDQHVQIVQMRSLETGRYGVMANGQ